MSASFGLDLKEDEFSFIVGVFMTCLESWCWPDSLLRFTLIDLVLNYVLGELRSFGIVYLIGLFAFSPVISSTIYLR